MSKTLVCCNTLTQVDQFVYSNHMQFWFRLGRNCPGDNFLFFTPRRMTIDRCRNEATKVALEQECDFLMFIDDDVLVPFDAYQRLKAHDRDLVAGWTIIRGFPFENMHFRFQQNEGGKALKVFNHDQSEGLIEVDAVGCSCALFKVEPFKKIPPPYFVTGPNHTEDIYACMKAKDYIPDYGIFVDLSVKTGHILGSEIITPNEKKLWYDFENLRSWKKEEKKDRGEEYLDEVRATFVQEDPEFSVRG